MVGAKISLKGRHFLTLKDFTRDEIQYLLDLAADLKKKKKNGILTDSLLKGKNIALIFEKGSTRTRCAYEVAAHDLSKSIKNYKDKDDNLNDNDNESFRSNGIKKKNIKMEKHKN